MAPTKIWLNETCPFDLDSTLCCGQAFRWTKHGEWWQGIVGDHPFRIRQIRNTLEFENADEQFVRSYFRLEDNLLEIFRQINKDTHIKKAIHRFSGLRILRQDPWECLISYICATYKNVPAIKLMITNLSAKFGNKTHLSNNELYTFPSPDALAHASTKDLASCGLGYRARYVQETATEICKNHFELERLKKHSYEEAKKVLLGFPGVGQKVADCTLLFSLEKLEAFPVDIWIKRAITKYYASNIPEKTRLKISDTATFLSTDYKQLNQFGREYFGKYAGYAQEYLYHYERTTTQQQKTTHRHHHLSPNSKNNKKRLNQI
ncbi:8-oxoguanine DNA glycosylase [Candidatus Bathyarchaeota archaeon]|nr:8-oxoguanine DNA glycosylase [Candidatus Bathyarchaeota archaeon]